MASVGQQGRPQLRDRVFVGGEALVMRQGAGVARQLGITERTVKAHLSTIFDKLGVKDRLQLAVRIIALRK